MDPGSNSVLPQTNKGGEVLVDHKKASGQAVPGMPDRIMRGINWGMIFDRHPELYPPGHDEAAQVTIENIRRRKEAASLQPKKAPSKKRPQSKKKR
jgi:hypothetical protein